MLTCSGDDIKRQVGSYITEDKMPEELNLTEEEEVEVFEFLDDLRESGVTNMFGATPHIVEEFDIPKTEARDMLSKWMKTFSDRHP